MILDLLIAATISASVWGLGYATAAIYDRLSRKDTRT